MIEHPWNMDDLATVELLDTTQGQIIVLGSFEAGAKASDLPQQGCSKDA